MLLGRVLTLRAVQIVREWPHAMNDLKDWRRFYYGYATFEEPRDAGEATSLIHSRTILPASVFS